MKWFRLTAVAAIIFIGFSCQEKDRSGDNLQSHKNLISFNNEFLRDLTVKEQEQDSYTYGKGSTQQEQKADTLYVTADFPWSGCADMEGDLIYKGDSLTLVYRLKEDVVCAEIIYYQLQYKILNKEKARYKVGIEYQEIEKTSIPNKI